jgi:hypothetical protein
LDSPHRGAIDTRPTSPRRRWFLATIANSRTQSLIHSGVHNASVALTHGFERAFLVGAGFAVAGAILAFVLISSRASREHSVAARSGDPAVAAVADG